MLIGELADAVGLPSQTIRFYERQGLLPQPQRQANGYRTYDDTAVARVQFIRNAQSAGLTLVEIGSIVDLRDHGHRPCTHVSGVLHTKLNAVRARQAELAALEQELERLVERSHDLDPADCSDADICHILTKQR
jgi:MerR family mercuric resistance operon transcriptional regulator